MFADIIYNPNSCGQHFFKRVHTWKILRAEVVAFLKVMLRDVKSSTCLCAVLFSRKNKTVLNQGSWYFTQTFADVSWKNDSISIFPFSCIFKPKMPLVNCQVYCFFASKLFNLADWRYRFCIVPTFCFHNVSPWILHGNPTHSWYVIGFPSLAFLQMAF